MPEFNSGLLTQFEELCALMLHLPKHQHYIYMHIYILTMCFVFLVILHFFLDCDLLFARFSQNTHFVINFNFLTSRLH